MQAIFQNRYGGSEVLEYGELPAPRLRAGQLRVAMAASSINPRDLLIRRGKYQLQLFVSGFPLVLGSDVVGTVVEVGRGVDRFRVGDVVMGMKNPLGGAGCHASEVCIDASAVVHKPAALGIVEAGGFPLCALTAFQALVRCGDLRLGQRVLVIGGSGGVGTFAVQVGAALGAEVVALASPANHELVRSLGASAAVDYQDPSYRTSLGRFDIVFDTIGRHSRKTCTSLLAPRGVFVSTIPAVPHLLDAAITRTVGRLGRGSRGSVVVVRPLREDLERLVSLVEEGRVKTVVDSTYPLAETARAHDRSATRRARGKIVIEGPGA
ncbi:MAG: NADP-dependent oxidoreductase [Deltaproteobacteria bacterium]|nr:NADP-dependent oxidoreductase [Deltaproteobacteria bacterium]